MPPSVHGPVEGWGWAEGRLGFGSKDDLRPLEWRGPRGVEAWVAGTARALGAPSEASVEAAKVADLLKTALLRSQAFPQQLLTLP